MARATLNTAVSTAVNPSHPAIELTVTRNGENQPVCCAGCQAVAGLIEASGLGRYYQFRQSLALKAEQDIDEVVDAWKGCDERESMWGTDLCNGTRELLLQTEGIRCAACSWLIRTHLEADRGVSAVQVDTATGYTRIVWNPEAYPPQQLAVPYWNWATNLTCHWPVKKSTLRQMNAGRLETARCCGAGHDAGHDVRRRAVCR